eukprot:scaffold2634_cov97-Cylindrotheca_fusiformis.AAC.1
MQLINLLVTASYDRVRILEQKIRDVNILQYPHQDCKQMVATYKTYCDQLAAQGSYKHDMTLTIINGFALAGGDIGSDPLTSTYTLNWRNKILQKENEWKKHHVVTKGMSRKDADDYMDKNRMSYLWVLKDITTIYNDLKENNQWPPAVTKLDKRAP